MSLRRDNFNRADSPFGLGTPSDSGANWTPYGVDVFGITSNAATAQVAPSQKVTMLSGGDADGTYTVKIVTLGADCGAAWRGTDDFNYFVAVTAPSNTTGYRKQSNSFNSVYSDSTNWASGDTFGVILSGSSHTLQRNGSTIGSFTDSFQNTATDNAGLRDSSGTGTKAVFDDVTWDPASTFTPDEDYRIFPQTSTPNISARQLLADEDVPSLLAGQPDEDYRLPIIGSAAALYGRVWAVDDDLPVTAGFAPDEDYQAPLRLSLPMPVATVKMEQDPLALLSGPPDEDYWYQTWRPAFGQVFKHTGMLTVDDVIFVVPTSIYTRLTAAVRPDRLTAAVRPDRLTGAVKDA